MSRRRGVVFFILNKDGYESYKNTGIQIISEEMLKDEIIHLFEVTYTRSENISAWALEVGQSTRDKMTDFFYHNGKESVLTPINYDQLLVDKKYKSALNEVGYARNYIHPHIKVCLSESQRVLQLIKDELIKS